MEGVVTWSAVTAIVGFFVWLTQERKLSFDLFTRRFDAYTTFLATALARREEIKNTTIEEIHKTEFKNTALTEFWKAKQILIYLFPISIKDQSDKIDNILLSIAIKDCEVKIFNLSSDGFTEEYLDKYNELRSVDILYHEETSKLFHLVEPYLRQATALEFLSEVCKSRVKWLLRKWQRLWNNRPFQRRY